MDRTWLKKGIIITLVGICVLLVSLPFIKGYDSEYSLLRNIGTMEIVLIDGQLVIPNKIVGKSHSGYDLVEQDYSATHYEGRLAIPYKAFLLCDMLTITLGVVIFLLSYESEKEFGRATKRLYSSRSVGNESIRERWTPLVGQFRG